MEIFESFQALFEQANPFFLAILLLIVGFLWFLPAILAFFFNRKHLKLIAAACIPAGFSIIAWCGLIIWAVTGRGIEKFVKTKKEPTATQNG